jgi:hypothetical protein
MKYCSGRKAFALPLVLIVLLVGSVLVAVTFDVVMGLFSSSRHVVEDVELYNAASDGIEQGKAWLLKAIQLDAILPRWQDPDGDNRLTEGNLEDTDPGYDVLIVESSSESADLSIYRDNISVNVKIYDMDYSAGSDLDEEYVPGFPPRLVYDAGEVEGMSARMGPTYATSNRGEGTIGSGSESVELGYYLIRSSATFEDNEKTIEEAVILRL